jgi:hypothetical protein
LAINSFAVSTLLEHAFSVLWRHLPCCFHSAHYLWTRISPALPLVVLYLSAMTLAALMMTALYV